MKGEGIGKRGEGKGSGILIHALRNPADDDDQTRFTWYFLTTGYSQICLVFLSPLKYVLQFKHFLMKISFV